MSIFLRGDPNPVLSIRHESPMGPGEWYALMLSDDPPGCAPLIVHVSRLVADGGIDEIENTAKEIIHV